MSESQTNAPCPAGITWYNKMQAIFAPYVQCMLNATGIDLSQYNGTQGVSVVENIETCVSDGNPGIHPQIEAGTMPRGNTYKAQWAKDQGSYWFNCWYQQGYPEGSPGEAPLSEVEADVSDGEDDVEDDAEDDAE